MVHVHILLSNCCKQSQAAWVLRDLPRMNVIAVSDLHKLPSYEGEAPSLDVIVIEYNDVNNIDVSFISKIRAIQTTAKIIVAADSVSPKQFLDIFLQGGQGFIPLTSIPLVWKQYLLTVAGVENLMTDQLALQVMRPFVGTMATHIPESSRLHPATLTPREEEVLQRVALGQLNREIAEYLSISEYTVKNHLKSISQKTHAKNRVQLTRYAFEYGIMNDGVD